MLKHHLLINNVRILKINYGKMSFNKRYINAEILKSAYESNGVDGLNNLLRADALLFEDSFAWDFKKLYDEYFISKDDTELKKFFHVY